TSGSRRRQPATTTASAPSSAASTTRACARPSSPSRGRLTRRSSRRRRGRRSGSRSSRASAPPATAYRVTWKSGRLASWLVTGGHKRIGIMYIVTALGFFVAGGILALLMRAQLATPDEHFLTKNSYNEVMTMHGTTMIFLVIVPILAGFGNYLVPLMIGARDMAFPRLNALSFWLYLLGGIVLWMSWF